MQPNTAAMPVTTSGAMLPNGVDTLQISVVPLEMILGWAGAEEIYDLLPEREQLILDLQMAGWSQADIANLFGLSQGWVSVIIRRIRFTLANSQLLHTLQIRQHYRETSPIMKGDPPDRYEVNE